MQRSTLVRSAVIRLILERPVAGTFDHSRNAAYGRVSQPPNQLLHFITSTIEGFYNPKHTQRRLRYRSSMDVEKKLFPNPVPTKPGQLQERSPAPDRRYRKYPRKPSVCRPWAKIVGLGEGGQKWNRVSCSARIVRCDRLPSGTGPTPTLADGHPTAKEHVGGRRLNWRRGVARGRGVLVS